jgi:hypothetical protein
MALALALAVFCDTQIADVADFSESNNEQK